MSIRNTRLALIEAAEKIVAERGFSALSMREIQLQAGQWNKNVVQYYFGSIPGIISAIVDIRMAPIDAHRKEILAEINYSDASPRDLFGAIVLPFTISMIQNPQRYYASFLVQTFCDPNLSSIVLDNFYIGSFREVYNRLLHCNDMDTEIAQRRLNSILGMILFAFARWQEGFTEQDNLMEQAQELIDMATASFIVQQVDA